MKKLNQIKSVARHTSTALLAVMIMFSARFAEAQTDNVGIGTVTPDNSSILDLTSTSRGFLIPRMTVVQRNSITTPIHFVPWQKRSNDYCARISLAEIL